LKLPGRSLNVESFEHAFEPGGRARGGAKDRAFLKISSQYLIYSTNTFTPIEDTEVFTQFSFLGGAEVPRSRVTDGTS
jgi:hypothetical protein